MTSYVEFSLDSQYLLHKLFHNMTELRHQLFSNCFCGFNVLELEQQFQGLFRGPVTHTSPVSK